MCKLITHWEVIIGRAYLPLISIGRKIEQKKNSLQRKKVAIKCACKHAMSEMPPKTKNNQNVFFSVAIKLRAAESLSIAAHGGHI